MCIPYFVHFYRLYQNSGDSVLLLPRSKRGFIRRYSISLEKKSQHKIELILKGNSSASREKLFLARFSSGFLLCIIQQINDETCSNSIEPCLWNITSRLASFF